MSITNLLRIAVFVFLTPSAWATEQITGYGDVPFGMTKSQLEKKLNQKAKVWFGPIQTLERQANIFGNSYRVRYLTGGDKLVSIEVYNFGPLKAADSGFPLGNADCGEYLQHLYSLLARKYGNSVLPLRSKVKAQVIYEYDAIFPSSNGAWLSFDGEYNQSASFARPGQEGPCYLSLTYHPPEPIGEGF